MRTLKAPGGRAQTPLFDPDCGAWWHTQLAPAALRQLEQGLEGVLRRSILPLLPAEQLGQHFDAEFGRPSKELYAMAGLLLLAEFRDWTIDQAAAAWSFDASVQFALNLPRDRQYLCPRSLDNYRRLLREDEAAQGIFETVTAALVAELGIEIKAQRLDSTHVLSNMARFGRLKLLAVTTKRFLTQLLRHHPEPYAALPAALRERYAAVESRVFGLGTKHPVPHAEALQTVAEDMAVLIEQFAAEAAITGRSSYQALARVFGEHCEVTPRGPVRLRPKAVDEHGQSSRVLQNPSDEGAGYDGHKGAGYQVQLAQACPGEDGPGLLTACLPQSAAESDSAAVDAVLAQQARMGTLPQEQLADTAYGSEANVQACAAHGVELIAPVPGRAASVSCQEAPVEASTTAAAPAPAPKLSWAQQRRAEQASAAWKKRYAKRSGLEGVHEALDRTTGLKALRVRGAPAVCMAICLKVTGWNIKSAAAILRQRARRRAKAQGAQRAGQNGPQGGSHLAKSSCAGPRAAHRYQGSLRHRWSAPQAATPCRVALAPLLRGRVADVPVRIPFCAHIFKGAASSARNVWGCAALQNVLSQRAHPVRERVTAPSRADGPGSNGRLKNSKILRVRSKIRCSNI
jgi:hypothetical protein